VTDHTPLTEQKLDDIEIATARGQALRDAETAIAAAIVREHAAVRDNGGDWTPAANRHLGMYAAERVVRGMREDIETDSASRPAAAASEDTTTAVDPTPLRWGLNDVLWGDDDSTIVMLSGPDGEPYWLELDPERAAVLRQNLAGPEAAREVVHACPAAGDGLTPCCGRTPFELLRTDRMSADPAAVTCTTAVTAP